MIFDFVVSSIVASYRLGQGRAWLQFGILVLMRCEGGGSSLSPDVYSLYVQTSPNVSYIFLVSLSLGERIMLNFPNDMNKVTKVLHYPVAGFGSRKWTTRAVAIGCLGAHGVK